MNKTSLLLRNKQKGLAPILIILGIVLVLGVAGGAFYVGKIVSTSPAIVPVITSIPKLSPTPFISPISTTTNETANWKTYTNTKYGYSIKYPLDLLYSVAERSDKDVLDSQCLGISFNKCILNISVLDENSWERQKQLLGLTLSSKEGTKEESFAGLTGLKRVGYFGETGSLYGFVLIFRNNGKVYKIWAYQRTEAKIDYTSEIDQILSTFKFTQ